MFDTDAASRVRRSPVGNDDKPYVVRLALAHGIPELRTEGVEAWWEGVREFTWILRVRGARVGYIVVRPVYDITVALASEAVGAEVKEVKEAVLRTLRPGRLMAVVPGADAVFERAGFRRDDRSAGVVYVRESIGA